MSCEADRTCLLSRSFAPSLSESCLVVFHKAPFKGHNFNYRTSATWHLHWPARDESDGTSTLILPLSCVSYNVCIPTVGTWMSDEDPDVQDIIAQLEELQLEQTRLLTRLRHAQLATRTAATDRPARSHRRRGTDRTTAPPTNSRRLAVGDYVKVVNPGPSQPTTGYIIRITQHRVTVENNGRTLQRAPRNVVLHDE